MYHLPQPVNHMDALLFTPNSNVNTRPIMKHWVIEPSKIRSTPNQVFKTKSLRKAYLLLIIFACHLYSKKSTETFLQNWVIVLDQLENEGRPFNLSTMLALQLKLHMSNSQSPPKDEKARFFMSTYLLDAICAQQQFPSMGWKCTPSDDDVNIYYKMFSKCRN